jgi:ADP-ribose pyrophosphatase
MFELLKSETMYHGRAFDVLRDQVRLPDGNVINLDIVEHVGSVAIVPVDQDGRVWFVRQYRHAARQAMLELPAGTLEANEPPEAGAHRELREEIGMAAGKLELLGDFYLAPGYSTERMYIYLATHLTPAPLPGDDDEFLSVETFSASQVIEMVAHGKFKDAKSLAALALARPYWSS